MVKPLTEYEFKKQVKALSQFRGRGTELISVYITPKYPISEITGKLRDEFGQASNIKSASTRKNVQSALEKILHYLKGMNKPPENGMAVFCGNVSESEGHVDIQLYSVIPPTPITVQFYRCESVFVLEPLREMLDRSGTYGLVVLDGKEATVALLKGTQITVIKKLHSTAQQKQHHGGQSAARFQRIHEETVEKYYQRVGEAMNAFVGIKNFEGVIVGGPGPSKDNFLKLAPFNYQLKILGVVDIGYTDEYGLREIIDKSGEIVANQEAVKEKKLLDEFLKQAVTEGLVTYGYENVRDALLAKKIEKLLVSEEFALYRVEYKCNQCGKTSEKIVEQIVEKDCECGGKLKPVSESDVVNELIAQAEEQGTQVQMVSRDTAEGKQFLATFNGLGAFLRYR